MNNSHIRSHTYELPKFNITAPFLTPCLKLEEISPLLVIIPSQIRSCLTTCMTTRALARLHVHAYRTPRRYYPVEPPLSRSSLKDRGPTPLNPHCRVPPIITDRWRVSRFHQTTGLQTKLHVTRFSPLNRLRFSRSLHGRPSIQLHLQHDSMVDDQSALAPHRLQALMCTVLNQPGVIVLSKLHKPLGPASRVSTPRSRSPSASRSYVVIADPTTVFCTNRLASIHQTA